MRSAAEQQVDIVLIGDASWRLGKSSHPKRPTLLVNTIVRGTVNYGLIRSQPKIFHNLRCTSMRKPFAGLTKFGRRHRRVPMPVAH